VKECKGCREVKTLDSFYKNSGCKDGHLNWCKPCVIKRYGEGRRQRQKTLLAYIHEIKLARGCADCGYNANAVALDFDHLPGHLKEARLASMAAGATLAKIKTEIAKCDVVCANCHRIRTAARRSPSQME
jgi:hypothetical protein